MKTNRKTAIFFGSFFIVAFLAYGTGSAFMESITAIPASVGELEKTKNTIIFSAILMALLHTLLNMGLAVMMVPILKPFGKTLTYGYLSAAIMCTVMLVVGVIFLLLLIPLGEANLQVGATPGTNSDVLFLLLKKANFYSYQVGMVLWGLGGLLFSTLIYRSQIAPRFFGVWGISGYAIFIGGAVAEIAGYPIGLLCDIPGGLFELTLSVWFITRGFYYVKTRATVVPA